MILYHLSKGTAAVSSESDEEVCRLTTMEDIEVEFAIMTDKIKQALINSKINIDSLIEQLRSISGVRNRNFPLTLISTVNIS